MNIHPPPPPPPINALATALASGSLPLQFALVCPCLTIADVDCISTSHTLYLHSSDCFTQFIFCLETLNIIIAAYSLHEIRHFSPTF